MKKLAFYKILVFLTIINLSVKAQNKSQLKFDIQFLEVNKTDTLKINLYTNLANSTSLNDSVISYNISTMYNKIASRLKITKKNKNKFLIYLPVDPSWVLKRNDYFYTGVAMEYNCKSGIIKAVFPKENIKIYTEKSNVLQASLDVLIYFSSSILK